MSITKTASEDTPSKTLGVVFITGCTDGGIGAHLVRRFLAANFTVYATARKLSSMSTLNHPNARKLVVDVTSDESVKAAVDKVYEETQGIDILVSNAGFSYIGPLLDVPISVSQKVVETNFFGFVRLVNEIVPRMAKREAGSVVAIGSILGELATPFQGFYNASKAALRSYAETLNMECSVDTVRVNVTLIAPGSTKSNICATSADMYESPPGTLYSAWEKQIQHVMVQSQTPPYNPMPTDVFADKVVSALTTKTGPNPHPPSYMTLGGFSTKWKILKALPRSWAEALLWYLAKQEPAEGTYGAAALSQ
ncbi:oxidoreductase [Hymenopellis radicata]|nr:oxidoreductase [Hymenopellis radicata]